MSGAELSHVVFYVILGMSVLGTVTCVGAMFSMGRASYKK